MWIQEFVTILKNLSKEQVQLKKKTKKIQTSETTLVSLVSTSQSKIIP